MAVTARGKNDVAGMFTIDWKEMERKRKAKEGKRHKYGMGPFWVNLYGGPPTSFVDKSPRPTTIEGASLVNASIPVAPTASCS